MAKQIARLLKTDVMADIDIPAIAQFLQSQGRRGDTILAHINAKEAEMLKKMGGAEERNPVTGLPEYFTIDTDYAYGANPNTNRSNSDEFYQYQAPRQGGDLYEAANFDLEARQSPFYGEYGGTLTPNVPAALSPSEIDPTQYYAARQYEGSGFNYSPAYEGMNPDEYRFQAAREFPAGMSARLPTEAERASAIRNANIAAATNLDIGQLRKGQQIKDRATAEKVAKEAGLGDEVPLMKRASAATGLSEQALTRLGLAGLGTIQGVMASREASEQGRQARRETEALARPYQQRGQELTQQAQEGQLTAQGQQQLQALRARLAQGAEARGGVGVAQAAAQVEAFRQNLLQNQYDYGQKVSNIGDQLMLGAIRTGLEADRYAASLSNAYFTNMASIAAGMPPSMPIQSRGE
jgi:hypothetical protein